MEKNNIVLSKDNYDLSALAGKSREEVEKLGKKTLLNIFDAVDSDKDGKISDTETSVFCQTLLSADTNKDGNIAKKELKKLLKSDNELITNILKNGKIKAADIIEFCKTIPSLIKTAPAANTEYEYSSMTDEEVQEETLNTMQDEVERAYEIFNSQDDGFIGKTYNQIKELLGSNISKSSVARNLYIKNETTELLRLAKNGTLTFEEYYSRIKQNLMETYPGVENMTEPELEKLAQMINSLSPERVQQIQKNILALPDPSEANYEDAVAEFNNNFKNETCTISTEYIEVIGGESGKHYEEKVTESINDDYSLKINGDNSIINRLMSFEEVFELRTGVKYNRENIEKYNQLSSEFAIQQSFEELSNYIHSNLDKDTSDAKTEKTLLQILESLSSQKDDNTLTKTLVHMTGISDIKVENGHIITADIQAAKQALINNLDAQINEVYKGKSFKELSTNLENAYKKAFGKDNVELLAKAYAKDQSDAVKNTRKAIEYAGFGAAVVGMFCCPALAIGAGIAGSIGGVGVELLDEATKEKADKERIKSLEKELGMNVALFAAGLGSGITGSAIGGVVKSLAAKCPVLMSIVAERGVDATLSLISTMAITGELDLQGVGLSQILAVLTGIKSAKVGVKNAASNPEIENLGFMAKPNTNSGIFSRFFRTSNIDPNSPLNKYKPTRNTYNDDHFDFHRNNPHLFKGTHNYGCWAGKESSDPHHGAWKMHLYSVSEEDWQRMADVIIPYLREHDIDWKTFNSYSEADCLNGGIQQGKAFTIYPRDNAHFEQIARDLDYIIRNNHLETTNTSIVGDNSLGNTGRIFYRYEYNSGKYKDSVLDLNRGSSDWDIYKRLYDSNEDRIQRNGHGRYLADDMTTADDPWYNFDPANPSSKPAASNQSRINNYNRTPNNFSKMQQDIYYQADRSTVLRLPNNVIIDFSDPYIMSILNSIPEGSYITVGRDTNCAIRINPGCDYVSRQHLIIYRSGGQLYVRDISTNGTSIS